MCLRATKIEILVRQSETFPAKFNNVVEEYKILFSTQGSGFKCFMGS